METNINSKTGNGSSGNDPLPDPERNPAVPTEKRGIWVPPLRPPPNLHIFQQGRKIHPKHRNHSNQHPHSNHPHLDGRESQATQHPPGELWNSRHSNVFWNFHNNAQQRAQHWVWFLDIGFTLHGAHPHGHQRHGGRGLPPDPSQHPWWVAFFI